MSPVLFEVFKDVLTASMAALVFVAGQGVLRFVIEPAAELRKTIGEVGFLLIFHAHIFHSPTSVQPELLQDAQKEARRLAAMLESRAQSVPFLLVWSKTGWLPTRRAIRDARGHLIFLSNNNRIDDREDRAFVHQAFRGLRERLKLPEME